MSHNVNNKSAKKRRMDMEKYISAKEIMECTGLGRNAVYAMMNYPGFPAARIGKRLVVSETAFMNWMNNGGMNQKAI